MNPLPQPVGSAPLPPAAYHDPAWWDREQDELFTWRWGLAGDLARLGEPGDYLTSTVGRAPLVVVRGADGRLRAFHNLCRHRGMVLLEGAGNVAGALTCPYHRWRYGLDGTLAAVPQRRRQFPDLDVVDRGLLRASVSVWEGMVFVNPDPAAAPLDDTLCGIPENLGSHRPGLLRQVATERIEARCNWKLLVENHVDVYHLRYLHAASLGAFDHRRFEYHQVGPNWASYEPLRSADLGSSSLTRGTATIGHLDERDRLGLGAHLVFPNLLMAAAAEFFVTYEAQPVAPDRTVIEVRVRAEDGADGGALLDAVRSFVAEDVAACEAVQRGVRSPAWAAGPLARDLERPIAAFHANLLARLPWVGLPWVGQR